MRITVWISFLYLARLSIEKYKSFPLHPISLPLFASIYQSILFLWSYQFLVPFIIISSLVSRCMLSGVSCPETRIRECLIQTLRSFAPFKQIKPERFLPFHCSPCRKEETDSSVSLIRSLSFFVSDQKPLNYDEVSAAASASNCTVYVGGITRGLCCKCPGHLT